jgi:ER membrane protein complex subunit 8/9
MAPQFVITHRAYLSLLLHTSKYPHQACNGVLLGTLKPSGETIVERSIPLLHHWTSLSPMMEIGLELVFFHLPNFIVI